MSKSKSKKSTFFWVCVVLAIIAVISLIVYLIICNCPERYHHYHNYDCKFKPLKSRSRYHHLNDLFCCENEEEDSMRKMGEVKDKDIKIPDYIPEKSRKCYIQEQKLLAQAEAKHMEMLNLDKKVNKTEEDEKKLKQLGKEHRELHDK